MSEDKTTFWEKIGRSLPAALGTALVGALGWLALEAGDWNRWRGQVDLRIDSNRMSISRSEGRVQRALEKIERSLQRIEDKLDKKKDK